jgi:hypothetical protein
MPAYIQIVHNVQSLYVVKAYGNVLTFGDGYH